jgi:tRNA-splicing endonuclease subunit Sen15
MMAVPESLQAAPSALTTFIESECSSEETSSHAAHLDQLAIQIRHNLQYQHRWTQLRTHTHSPLTQRLLPRPIISGLPPRRLYVHPDEQVEMLRAEMEKQKNKKASLEDGLGGDDEDIMELEPEREWVLPAHLREDWSLRRFAEIFDAIGLVPPEINGNDLANSERTQNKWRTVKRVLLSTVQDDSTVVYYIVHDGIVKPRQN